MSKILEGDREEGEIVDDEFEEISDSSMILSFNDTGKSLNYKEHLPVISLSSVSDSDDEIKQRKIGIMKKFDEKFRHHRHHHYKWKKKMKGKYFKKFHKMKKWKKLLEHSNSSSYSSDENLDVELDRELQTQLKAAIKVDKSDNHRNSLRTRLKAMVKINNAETEKTSDNTKSDSDYKINENETPSKEPTEEVDNELMQLRVEALRSAVLNKLAHRKKRKKEDTEIHNDVNSDTNKENNINESKGNKKPCLDGKVDLNSSAPEEDEDVLRALLLASISKKKSKEEINNIKLPIIDKRIDENNIATKQLMPLKWQIAQKIKPIIINLSSNSESEEDITETITKDTNVNINHKIESSVEHFLKEQRAKVEAQMKQKQIPPQKPPVKNTIPKQIQRQSSDESMVLEKSSVKLLPKIKQIEYQRLMQKLKNAQKKSRIRKPSVKESEGGSSPKKNNHQKISGPEMNKELDIKHDAKTLHMILKGMQKQQNGRLQIEEKYVVLTPIIRKINETSMERKKYDQEVKRLMGVLAETNRKLQETHRQFSGYVKELLTKKDEIDKSPSLLNKIGPSKIPFTSTPIKPKLPLDSLEVSTVDCTPNDTQIPDPSSVENIPNSSDTNTLKTLEIARDTIDDLKLTIQATKEKDIVFKMDGVEIVNDVDVKKMEIGDIEMNPNDIQNISENRREMLPNYVSPLDNITRKNNYDPFLIMCPFDINGNCRDPECTYNHYSR